MTLAALIVGGIALIIAFVALGVALYDARNNSKQLKMLIDEASRKPLLSLTFRSIEAKETAESNGIKYTKVEVRFGVSNDDSARKSASAIFLTASIPDSVLTEDEYKKAGQTRASTSAYSLGIYDTMISSVSRSVVAPRSPLFDEDDIERAKSKNGYRAVTYSGEAGDVLLPGLVKSVSVLMTLYVPNGCPAVEWTMNCHELTEWLSGELVFGEAAGEPEEDAGSKT